MDRAAPSNTNSSGSIKTDGASWTTRLSVMDMRMNAYSFRALYVFPSMSRNQELNNGSCGSKTEKQSDRVERLEQSFEQLLQDDYPFLIDGEMHVDPATGLICLRARQDHLKKKALLEFDSVVNNSKSTRDVLHSLDFSLAPSRDQQGLIAVKCTSLRDGGFVVGLNVNHCVFDADACFTFMNQWGMHYRSVEKAQRPVICHDRHLIFCGQEDNNNNDTVEFEHPEYTVVDVSPELQHEPKASVKPFPTTTQRVFRINHEELKNLKAYVAAGINSDHSVAPGYISTMDALTALMTVLITQARGHQRGVNVGTAVSGRKRLEPQLPDNYAGNAVFTAFSTFKSSELQCALDGDQHQLNSSAQQVLAAVALRVRQSILKQNSAFMRDTIAFLTSLQQQQQQPAKRVEASTKFFFGSDLMFSSWVGLGSLDATFDGVRPLCVSSPAMPVCDGMVVFQEESGGVISNDEPTAGGIGGNGVDVLVYLEVGAMARLERMWSAAAAQCWTTLRA